MLENVRFFVVRATDLKGKEGCESEGEERVVFEWGFGRDGCQKGEILGFSIAFLKVFPSEMEA
jgi:hypothetical protein